MASSDLASSESNCVMSVQCICILLRRAAHHWHCMAELAGNRSLFFFSKLVVNSELSTRSQMEVTLVVFDTGFFSGLWSGSGLMSITLIKVHENKKRYKMEKPWNSFSN